MREVTTPVGAFVVATHAFAAGAHGFVTVTHVENMTASAVVPTRHASVTAASLVGISTCEVRLSTLSDASNVLVFVASMHVSVESAHEFMTDTIVDDSDTIV